MLCTDPGPGQARYPVCKREDHQEHHTNSNLTLTKLISQSYTDTPCM